MPDTPDPDQVFAGVPDAFERLWTPHRMAYIKGENKPSGPDEGCPFDRAPKLTDEDGLIVARGALVYAVLNLYPYNSGHVLICPYRHVADYTELTGAETTEFSEFTKRAVRALRQASGAQGFNIGMNLGSVAGAGIAAHLHQHVVPRWGGDTNFMPVTGRTRVLPQLLADTRKLLAEAWPAVLARGATPRNPPQRFAPRCGTSPYHHAAGKAGGPPQAARSRSFAPRYPPYPLVGLGFGGYLGRQVRRERLVPQVRTRERARPV